ncbi:hypothetical protein CLOM_g5446, partial [Closterium sp. NIES-68]
LGKKLCCKEGSGCLPFTFTPCRDCLSHWLAVISAKCMWVWSGEWTYQLQYSAGGGSEFVRTTGWLSGHLTTPSTGGGSFSAGALKVECFYRKWQQR